MEYKYVYSEPIIVNGKPIIWKDDIIETLNDTDIHNHTTYNTYTVSPEIKKKIMKGSVSLESFNNVGKNISEKKDIKDILSILFGKKSVQDFFLIAAFNEFYKYMDTNDIEYLKEASESISKYKKYS